MQRALLALRAARDDADEATIDAAERAITAAIAGDGGGAAKRAGKRAGSARGEDKAGAGKRLDVTAALAAGRVGAGGVGGSRREKTNAGGGKRAKGVKMLAEKIVLSAGHAAGHARHAAATFPGDVARQLRLAQQQLAQSHAPFAMHGPGHVDAGGRMAWPRRGTRGTSPRAWAWAWAWPRRRRSARQTRRRPSTSSGAPRARRARTCSVRARPARRARRVRARRGVLGGAFVGRERVGGGARGGRPRRRRGAGGAAAAANMLSFESDLDFPMEAVGLTGLGGPIGVGVGDPLAMDAELGLLLDAPGDGLVMDGGLL